MSLVYILLSVFFATIIALIVALVKKGKIIEEMETSNKQVVKENQRLEDINESLRKREFIYRRPFYDLSHKIVLTDSMSARNDINKLEDDGYNFNKENSMPGILCFTKRVEIAPKDETPSES